MKSILFILGFGLIASVAGAQEIRDAKNNIVAYIDPQATSLLDKEKNTLCTFQQDGRIVDTKANTLGFIVNEYELQDKNHKTVGFITRDGMVQNSQHAAMGRINVSGSGPVTDNNSAVIGYINRVEPMWAAAYFYVLKF
jgi:hypothetical protein